MLRALKILLRQRRPALGVEDKERRLREAMYSLGMDVGAFGMCDILYDYFLKIHYGPLGKVMDEMYAERMIDGRISS